MREAFEVDDRVLNDKYWNEFRCRICPLLTPIPKNRLLAFILVLWWSCSEFSCAVIALCLGVGLSLFGVDAVVTPAIRATTNNPKMMKCFIWQIYKLRSYQKENVLANYKTKVRNYFRLSKQNGVFCWIILSKRYWNVNFIARIYLSHPITPSPHHHIIISSHHHITFLFTIYDIRFLIGKREINC